MMTMRMLTARNQGVNQFVIAKVCIEKVAMGGNC